MKISNVIFKFKPLITGPSSLRHTFSIGPVGTGMSSFSLFWTYNMKVMLIVGTQNYHLYNLGKLLNINI